VGTPTRAAITAASVVLFSVLATCNAGGYRYGASDQAFYIPAIEHHLEPGFFPRDWPMLAAQDRLNLFTPAAAWLAGAARLPLAPLFAALYTAGLAVLGAAGLSLAGRLCRSRWTAVALLGALALRHAVALGAVNTLEGYMHPRSIAFALGALAMARFLAASGRDAALLLLLAAIVHPTTAIWFALLLGVAVFAAEPRRRPVMLALAGAGALAAAWAATGPLAPRFVRMDDGWLAALEAKTYLFPDRWPAWAWAVSALTAAVPFAGCGIRLRQGLAGSRETGLVWGAAALVLAFAASLPFVAARVAFAVQLQVPRVLWLLDLLAVVYLVWLLAEAAPRRGGPPARRRPAMVAALLVAASAGRGAWVMLVEHPERDLVVVSLPPTDWNRALEWVRHATPPSAHVLADPGHAWRYGTSVRVAAARDVFLEEAKDGAFALYSRGAAVRFVERVRETQGFGGFGEVEVRRLAERYALDVLVTEQPLNLPLLHHSGRFRVYSLRR
jgi:hypothetical protein